MIVTKTARRANQLGLGLVRDVVPPPQPADIVAQGPSLGEETFEI